MTGPRQSREDRSADQLLAGKYVLGLLSEEARHDVEQRMRRDRGFAKVVLQWTNGMATELDDEDAPRPQVVRRPVVRPPVWRGRRSDLMLLVVYHAWQSATFWRFVSLLLLFVVLTLIAA